MPTMRCVPWSRILRSLACGAVLATLVAGCAGAVYEPEARASESMDDLGYLTEQAIAGAAGLGALVDRNHEPPHRLAGSGGATDAADDDSQPSQPSPPQDTSDTAKTPPKRLVIYTAELRLLVANARAALEVFVARVEKLDGYLERRTQSSVTVRVPADRFETVLDETRESGKVTFERIDALDVTRQFRDLTIRLETAETSRKRLLEILEKAEKVEDILKIENEIRRLVTEIETMKAELRTLSDRVAFSTITVVFEQNAPEVTTPRRRRSRFEWINQVGIEHLLDRF